MAEEKRYTDEELLEYLVWLDEAEDITVDSYEAGFLGTILDKGFSTEKQKLYARTLIEKYEIIP